jgi:23S rRNA pseudouridine1911/1915/1917 synthase
VNPVGVPSAADGQRLDVWLAGHLGISRSQAAARIDAGQVRVGGVRVSRGRRLRADEQVEVVAPAPTPASPPPPLPPIRYRDEHLLVVAKPAGLVVHPGAGHPDGTLVEALEAAGIPLAPGTEGHRPGIVHRLDRDTSGLLLVASTQEAFVGLTAALAARQVARRYLAVVAGVPEQPRGRIEAPIARDPRAGTANHRRVVLPRLHTPTGVWFFPVTRLWGAEPAARVGAGVPAHRWPRRHLTVVRVAGTR